MTQPNKDLENAVVTAFFLFYATFYAQTLYIFNVKWYNSNECS